MKKTLGLLFGLFIFIALPLPAQAGEPRLLEARGNWSAYIFTEDGNKVCYMASKPTKAEGKYTSRGEPFALVTHRPSEGTRNVFSYITGYTYKAGSDAIVSIDGERFVLFTQDGTAWAPDADTDERLANAIRKGSKMIVTGVSSRGTETKDTFSLSGSGGAHDRITKECR